MSQQQKSLEEQIENVRILIALIKAEGTCLDIPMAIMCSGKKYHATVENIFACPLISVCNQEVSTWAQRRDIAKQMFEETPNTIKALVLL